MASRWYNPAVGQFMNKDTIAQNPVPNSAAANPFAYVDDNPLDGTDPSGHGWLSKAWHATTHFAAKVWHATTAVAKTVWNKTKSAASDLFSAAMHEYQTQLKKINDAFNREMAKLKADLKKLEAQIKAVNNEIKQKAKAAQHIVTTTYHAVAAGAKATGSFLKNHAAAIGSFVVSTGVFLGCEAVLGAATGGVGAVAGAVACGALSGAAGGLFTQGAKCLSGAKGGCSASAFLKAGVIGGAVGGLAGLGGALGGKLLSAVGGRALSAIGGLFGRGATDLTEGIATDAATSAGDSALEGTADNVATSATEDASSAATEDASSAGAHESSDPVADEPSPDENTGQSCENSLVPHSFTGSTPVLLADGTSKPIDQIKVGDKIADSVPGQQDTQTHTVQNVIVTTTDHDFVDITIKPNSTHTAAAKGLAKALAGLAVMAAALAPAQGGSLTTTFHHPFYDQTQAAFVDAQNLRVGDVLQTPSGTATITTLHLYHANTTTYDLTINGLHTYYVVAGDTPVLVHNCGGSSTANPRALQGRVQRLADRMGSGAGRRTAAGLHLVEATDLFAVGARSEISGAQMGLLDAGDEALRMSPRLPSPAENPLLLGRLHAEGKLLIEAMNLGAQPGLLVASRDFCDEFCAPLIERTGGKILTPTMARW